MKATSARPAGSTEGDGGRRGAFETAEHVFWCNTNRGGGPGGDILEQRMHAEHFAAAWTGGKGTPQVGRFNYPAHMRRVESGDVIVMYTNGLGAIAIGRATEGGLEVLGHDRPERIRDYVTEGQNAEEWRIPVEWLVWDDDNPCAVAPLRPSFQEITGHTDRIRAIRQHFRL